MLVYDYLLQSANKYPEKPVVFHGNKSLTYHELSSLVRSQASWLISQKFDAGFRCGILTDDPFEYISAYFAIQLAGGIVVGLNTQTSERSLKTLLTDSRISVVFAQKKFHRYLAPFASQLPSLKLIVSDEEFSCNGATSIWMDRQVILKTDLQITDFPVVKPDDIAQIIYTSGTTGSPKGVMLRHANLVANTSSIITYLKLTENDKVMAVLPFFYSYGNSVLLTHIAVGGSLVVNQNFLYPNVILDEMLEREVTGFSGVPSTFALLLNRSAINKYHFPKLRYLTQAGAAMSPKLAGQLQKVFPEAEIFVMYGQTEASARLSYLPPEDLERKMGSIGRAIPGVTLKLLDRDGRSVADGETGEIVAVGDNIMAGYWERRPETDQVLREEGLWTGDLARRDHEGYFYIVSRKSDMIKSGSHRIAPKEIEEIIHEHEAVHEVAVLGVEDEILGETIKACVVLKPGVTCLPKELLLHCRRNLPAFKVPHRIVFFDELPKTATGKIIKRQLMADG
ncbi:MAG: acyl--CoA ligase [Desulfobulbaceae bacterium]|nr:acyl--CoA ligase [Pseudomonadota bacterium]MCG2746195.1 acyl--CoA ligase [Desulfobulbaceae bacterium]